MAEFKFNCPQCGQTIEADESARGLVAECPYCSKGIVVPKKSFLAFSRDGENTDSDKHSKSEAQRVSSHQYVFCGGMVFDCGTPDSENNHETKISLEEAKEREQQFRLEQTYICTHCGTSTNSPQKAPAWVGCLLVLGAFFMGGLIGMINSLAGIVVFIFYICFGLFTLAKGNRMRCRNCGKLDTMISVTSPQGKRLFKETGQDAGMTDSPFPLPVQPQQQDVSERLNKIQKLLDDGMISAEEYDIQRKRILESL